MSGERLVRRAFIAASIILLLSGIMDLAVYMISRFHAPAWALGASWIAMAIMLLAAEKALRTRRGLKG